jgi:hypothetical protein
MSGSQQILDTRVVSRLGTEAQVRLDEVCSLAQYLH